MSAKTTKGDNSMGGEQQTQFNELVDKHKDIAQSWIDYWFQYSSFDTWQFWANFIMLITPLVVLYFFMDRSRAFHLGFFGFSHHVLALYLDGFGTRQAFWEYPYKLLPFLPNNLGLDSSLIPVVYILMYQWVFKNGKNYYVYAIFVSAFFSFIYKPILAIWDLFRLENGTEFWHLFLVYYGGAVLAKWVTNLFLLAEKSTKK